MLNMAQLLYSDPSAQQCSILFISGPSVATSIFTISLFRPLPLGAVILQKGLQSQVPIILPFGKLF
jgi:hypothetical protein